MRGREQELPTLWMCCKTKTQRNADLLNHKPSGESDAHSDQP